MAHPKAIADLGVAQTRIIPNHERRLLKTVLLDTGKLCLLRPSVVQVGCHSSLGLDQRKCMSPLDLEVTLGRRLTADVPGR